MAYFDDELNKYNIGSYAPLSNVLQAAPTQEMAPLQLPKQQPGIVSQMATAGGSKAFDEGYDAYKKSTAERARILKEVGPEPSAVATSGGPLSLTEPATDAAVHPVLAAELDKVSAAASPLGSDMASAAQTMGAATDLTSTTASAAGPLGDAAKMGAAIVTGKGVAEAAGSAGGAAIGNMLLPGIGGIIGSKLGGMAGNAVGGK